MKSSFSNFSRCLLVGAVSTFAIGALAEPSFETSDGLLMGAQGVLVDDVSYDVSFLEGTCNSLYENCTSFVFDTAESARKAAVALQNQVFVGRFDDSPNLTNGCTDPLFAECQILTVYAHPSASLFSAAAFLNRSAIWDDAVINYSGVTFEYGDTKDIPTWTFAVWRQSDVAVAIPEPGTNSLMIAGLGVMVMAVRRRKVKHE